MQTNPHLQVFIASGYFDLATPHFATDYTVDHLQIGPELRANIAVKYYEAGHMMYIHKPSLASLSSDLRDFIARSQ
jgi:carboxypeptidase C (cathepsin A)